LTWCEKRAGKGGEIGRKGGIEGGGERGRGGRRREGRGRERSGKGEREGRAEGRGEKIRERKTGRMKKTRGK